MLSGAIWEMNQQEVPLNRNNLVAFLLLAVLGVVALLGLGDAGAATVDVPTQVAQTHLAGVDADAVDWKHKTAAWWKQTLPAPVYQVCRQSGTERPFTGALLKEKRSGDFVCSSCAHVLFRSETKFKSGTGWPSFSAPAAKDSLTEIVDKTHGMVRTEVRCGRCDAHLGHVFPDGPEPTGLRYCINSVCLLHTPDAG